MGLDLETVGQTRELESWEVAVAKPPALKALRDSHHAVARAFALGLRPAEVSLQTGYSLSRLSILQGDPSFIELVSFYRASKETVARDIEAQFLLMGMDFVQELHSRLLDAPESMTDGLVLEATKALLDRAGYAPVSRSINQNINRNYGERMDKANGRKVAA